MRQLVFPNMLITLHHGEVPGLEFVTSQVHAMLAFNLNDPLCILLSALLNS